MKGKDIFHMASAEEIVAGKTTDIYFERTLQILQARGIDRRVVADIRAKELPGGNMWAVFAGLDEVLRMLERLGSQLGSNLFPSLLSAARYYRGIAQPLGIGFRVAFEQHADEVSRWIGADAKARTPFDKHAEEARLK